MCFVNVKNYLFAWRGNVAMMYDVSEAFPQQSIFVRHGPQILFEGTDDIPVVFPFFVEFDSGIGGESVHDAEIKHFRGAGNCGVAPGNLPMQGINHTVGGNDLRKTLVKQGGFTLTGRANSGNVVPVVIILPEFV
jgi:hypothetical protein